MKKEILLKVNNVSVNFGSVIALENVSISIDEGEIVSLIGPNGAGKSTLLKLIMKEIDLSDGTIEWREGIRIGYLSQDLRALSGAGNSLDENKTVREFLFDFDITFDWEQEVEINIAINKLRIKPYLDQKI
jgi:ATPase subunit of ABC transporter with duplicated ATPase domains